MKPLRLVISAPWASCALNYYLELELLFTLTAKSLLPMSTHLWTQAAVSILRYEFKDIVWIKELVFRTFVQIMGNSRETGVWWKQNAVSNQNTCLRKILRAKWFPSLERTQKPDLNSRAIQNTSGLHLTSRFSLLLQKMSKRLLEGRKLFSFWRLHCGPYTSVLFRHSFSDQVTSRVPKGFLIMSYLKHFSFP